MDFIGSTQRVKQTLPWYFSDTLSRTTFLVEFDCANHLITAKAMRGDLIGTAHADPFDPNPSSSNGRLFSTNACQKARMDAWIDLGQQERNRDE